MLIHLVQYKDDTSYGELRVDYYNSSSEALKMWNMDGGPITVLEQRDVEDVFRVVVAGSRDFNDYDFLRRRLDHLLQYKQNIVIVSGHARGADRLGERYAKERGHFIDTYIPDWQPTHLKGKTDRSAGHKRNADMAQNADAAVLFWDGESPGTAGMAKLCQRYELDYRIENYKEAQQ